MTPGTLEAPLGEGKRGGAGSEEDAEAGQVLGSVEGMASGRESGRTPPPPPKSHTPVAHRCGWRGPALSS